MDYGKSFSYIFEDKNWVTKFLIGVVVGLVPIVQFATFGYILEIVKNVRDGREQPLPEWDDFGDLFINGLKFVLGTLVYLLPLFIVAFMSIPFSIMAGEDPGALFGLGMTALACLIILLTLIPLVLTPVLMVQYAKDNKIGDMFKFSEMWDMITADLGAYLIIVLFLGLVIFIVGGIGLVACFIGVIFTSWYAYLVAGHITGQFAAQQPGTEKLA
jgi:hypothetical protein